MTGRECPLCGGKEGVEFFHQPSVPTNVIVLFDDPTEARAWPRGSLRLLACPACGLVYNADVDPALIEYSARIEETQAFSPHFVAYAEELASHWLERHGLRGRRVLEVGCADAFGTRLVVQEVKRLTAVDFDPVFIADVRKRMDPRWAFACRVHDLLRRPVPGAFDGAYALDVIEHIPKEHEDRFLGNMVRSLTDTGVLILGTPSLHSQTYASGPSKAGHVNCKDAAGLKELLERFFHHAFVFSMNDEVIHTGYYPMAHYLMALACHRRGG